MPSLPIKWVGEPDYSSTQILPKIWMLSQKINIFDDLLPKASKFTCKSMNEICLWFIWIWGDLSKFWRKLYFIVFGENDPEVNVGRGFILLVSILLLCKLKVLGKNEIKAVAVTFRNVTNIDKAHRSRQHCCLPIRRQGPFSNSLSRILEEVQKPNST